MFPAPILESLTCARAITHYNLTGNSHEPLKQRCRSLPWRGCHCPRIEFVWRVMIDGRVQAKTFLADGACAPPYPTTGTLYSSAAWSSLSCQSFLPRFDCGASDDVEGWAMDLVPPSCLMLRACDEHNWIVQDDTEVFLFACRCDWSRKGARLTSRSLQKFPSGETQRVEVQ